MRYRNIKCNLDGPTAVVTLPHRGGCTFDPDTAEELRDCCRKLGLRDDLRVVAITGSGPTFAIGRANPPSDVSTAPMSVRLDWINRMGVADAVAGLPMPTIAVINGDALAHGLELALAADLRVAVDTARLGLGGLSDCGFPYDGGTQRLPRLAGQAVARDMILTGRILDAPEARDAGLVNRIATRENLDACWTQLVAEVVAAAPIAARYAKEAVNSAGDLTLSQGLRVEADLNVILQSTGDRAEGLRSFAEKRAPTFDGR